MVSLSPFASPLPYSQQELLERDLVARRANFRQHVPEVVALTLPWTKRQADLVLDRAALDRLAAAFEHVIEYEISKTVLIAETNALWLVNVARNVGGNGFQLTWRFICAD